MDNNRLQYLLMTEDSFIDPNQSGWIWSQISERMNQVANRNFSLDVHEAYQIV